MFGELHTADWWLAAEKELPQGPVMLAPLKLFLDECALTSFSNAKVFPLLQESANILDGNTSITAFLPILRSEAMVCAIYHSISLVGTIYCTDSFHCTQKANKSAHLSRLRADLVHACLDVIFEDSGFNATSQT